jgi:signal transduction histidine kinase
MYFNEMVHQLASSQYTDGADPISESWTSVYGQCPHLCHIVHALLPRPTWDQAAPASKGESQAGLTGIKEATILVEERIRRALARDLHDGPIQLISALLMQLDFCRQVVEKEPALIPDQLAGMRQLGERAICQMRTMLFELYPVTLETQGLCAALRVFLEQRQKMAHTTRLTLHIEARSPDTPFPRQEARVESALFAIVREAVTNALKHAQAAHIAVRLRETPSAIHIAVVDDGKGFDVARVMRHYDQQHSLGLLTIQERTEWIGGRLEIQSVPGQGTCVAICVPREMVSSFHSSLAKEETQW